MKWILLTLLLALVDPVRLALAQQLSPVDVCVSALAYNPELAAIKDKVALGSASDQSIRMLANKEIPTKAETEVIGRWIELRGECLKRDQKSLPQARPVFNALQEIALELVEGKITYGEFGRRRADSAQKAQAAAQELASARKREACERAMLDVAIHCKQSAATTGIIGGSAYAQDDGNSVVRAANCSGAQVRQSFECRK